MVTGIDAFCCFSEFDTAEFLQDRFGREGVPEEDQRTIYDLFADQIEFANKMLSTGISNIAEAIASPGWLKSLRQMTVMVVQGRKRVAPKPKILEYGKFILLQEEPKEDSEGEDNDDGTSEDEASNASAVSNKNTASAGSDSEKLADDGDEKQSMTDKGILANRKPSPHFSGLHRSKGIFWLATRPFQLGSWSTSGAMLTLGSEMPWFCCEPEEDWGADSETVTAIRIDFPGEWGTQRQELMFIGEKLDVEGLTKMLDACLLSRAEMRK
ncbi:hypothetical protein EJ07DRAFT_173389 [Lizonia empirigonia]|nr:hypothetical protein EJ07DRAFT_173389 [Lizonia empirigonia]